MNNLTDNEIKLLAIIRSLHPFEKLIINGDKDGRADTFIVERSYREILVVQNIPIVL